MSMINEVTSKKLWYKTFISTNKLSQRDITIFKKEGKGVMLCSHVKV